MQVYLLEIYETKEANIPDFGLVFKSMELLLKYTEQHIAKLQPSFHDDAEELQETGLALSLNEEETVRVTILPVIEDVDDDKYNKYVSDKGHKEQQHTGEGKGKGAHNKEDEDEEEHPEGEEEHSEGEEADAEGKHPAGEHKDAEGKHPTAEHPAGEHTEGEEGEEADLVDGVLITDGGETEIPSNTHNIIVNEPIKDGDKIIDFHDNKDNKENPKYMLMTTYEKLNTPKKDPWNRLAITTATTYKAKIKNSGSNTRTTRKNEKPVQSKNSA